MCTFLQIPSVLLSIYYYTTKSTFFYQAKAFLAGSESRFFNDEKVHLLVSTV